VLELDTGECVRSYFDKSNSDNTISFLEQIYQRFADHILLIWDQARYHTSKKVQRWLDEHPRITAILLPKKSPQLNPVEMIWRHLKDRIAANLTRSLEAIQAACETAFQQLLPSDLLRMAGLLYS
jgi:transposase